MNYQQLPNGIVLDDALFDRIVSQCKTIVSDAAPNPSTRVPNGNSTGNLALNAVRIKNRNVHRFRFTIYVDVHRAPYMPLVTKKTHWADGRPYEYNEWFDKAAADVANYVADVLGGKVVKS